MVNPWTNDETRERKPFYSAIPLEVMRRVGLTLTEGLNNYDPSIWDRYYQQKFQPEDFLMSFDHAIEHIYKGYDEMVNGRIHDGNEDHIAHAIANLMMIVWATENGKLPNKLQQTYMDEAKTLEILQNYENDNLNMQSESVPDEEIPEPVVESAPSQATESLLKFFGMKKG
jgi:hypothetical protein